MTATASAPTTFGCYAAVRRLAYAATHPPVYEMGVSEAALLRIKGWTEAAESADPRDFRPQWKGGDGDLRRHVRYLCALIPESIPDSRLAQTIRWIINNDGLTLSMVEDILGGHEQHETSGAKLRQAGLMLRAGASQSQVSRTLGLHRGDVVAPLAAFLDCSKAHDERLRDLAADIIEEGGSVDDLVEQASLSPAKASALYDDVKAALA